MDHFVNMILIHKCPSNYRFNYRLLRANYSSDVIPPVKFQNPRKLLVGLGNPGPKFERTRHNIGNMAITHFLTHYVQNALQQTIPFKHEINNHGDTAYFELPFHHKGSNLRDDLIDISSARRKQKTVVEGVPHPNVNIALLLPTTYMNRSGVAVKTFMNHHRWRLKNNPSSLSKQDELCVVLDDVSLPFGTITLKTKGGAGGQNGLRDIIKCVATPKFTRIRIGVGAPEWFIGGQSGAPAGTAIDNFVLSKFNADEQEQLPLYLNFVDDFLRLYIHRGASVAASMCNGMTLKEYSELISCKKINL